jgi:hypothetical protein
MVRHVRTHRRSEGRENASVPSQGVPGQSASSAADNPMQAAMQNLSGGVRRQDLPDRLGSLSKGEFGLMVTSNSS